MLSKTALDLYAQLYTFNSPQKRSKFAKALGLEPNAFQVVLDELNAHLLTEPFMIQEINDEILLRLRSEFKPAILALKPELNQNKTKKLSPQALETLSIIAYKQPVTKTEIDQLRSADSEKTINFLLKAGLIQCSGDLKKPGCPLLYLTTDKFLMQFNIRSIAELPVLDRDNTGVG